MTNQLLLSDTAVEIENTLQRERTRYREREHTRTLSREAVLCTPLKWNLLRQAEEQTEQGAPVHTHTHSKKACLNKNRERQNTPAVVFTPTC